MYEDEKRNEYGVKKRKKKEWIKGKAVLTLLNWKGKIYNLILQNLKNY